MKRKYQNLWRRMVPDIFRPSPAIRQFHVVPFSLNSPARRFLQRGIIRELRNSKLEPT